MLQKLQDTISYHFKDASLLECAMTHKSCKKPFNNERLEFLGDAVVDLVIGEYLFERFPHYQEGKLSKIRASIVSEEGLTKFAKEIGLDQCIFLSPAEESNHGREKPSILADAFEALMGAIFLEEGLIVVKRIINQLIKITYDHINFELIISDYKTSLQEVTQARFGVIPEYILIQETGPDHQKSFEMAIKIAQKEYARAIGSSKKQAQQECAKLAYEILQAQ
ncbi:ribonuclease III [Helicobacter kayseriensis]|uniref:ribonuclease III n=1 Tax=Helicobacter kayseriensis TaxID=2905877 RepID=UPI001E54AFAE|nr:ribonuclease III [Helicobacter kayseriensis]MCE3047661.1 ribonuclease III [Helicobacter kayseriensis]MCE3048987.1 ribonuclease III [Helicobacter kayseriensis]